MKFSAVAPALLSLVAASYDSDASVVSSAASHLSSLVVAWNSNAGLLPALNIQEYYPTLSSAVSSLSIDAETVSDSGIDTGITISFASEVTGLLNALTTKAADFSKVGVSSIVGSDIENLNQPAADIISDLSTAIAGDCDKQNSLTSVVSALESAFTAADNAFNVNIANFPSLSPCW